MRLKGGRNVNYEFVVENEIYTNASDEEDLIKIFNEKLALLIIYYQKIGGKHCDNKINAI